MWRFVAARATGTSHQKVGTPCQDAYACEVLACEAPAREPSSRGMVAAVADGAGSAAHSEIGAEIAVRTAVAEAKRRLDAGRTDFEALLQEAVLCAREAVIEEAVQAGSDPVAYASTLLTLLVTPDGGAAAQVGDGVMVVAEEGGDWCWVFWPQHGEYANTTSFLTSEDANARLETGSLPGSVSDFALTTDGLERLVLHLDTQTVHAPFFEAMFRPLWATDGGAGVERLSIALQTFLASDRVAARTDDDVTLVLATCRSPDADT